VDLGLTTTDPPHGPTQKENLLSPRQLPNYAWSQSNGHYDRCLLADRSLPTLAWFTYDPALHDPAFGSVDPTNQPYEPSLVVGGESVATEAIACSI